MKNVIIKYNNELYECEVKLEKEYIFGFIFCVIIMPIFFFITNSIFLTVITPSLFLFGILMTGGSVLFDYKPIKKLKKEKNINNVR